MLFLVVLTGTLYITMPENVRIDFSETKTVFKIWENEKFVTSGTEYTRIFDGSTLMRAKERSLNYSIIDNITQVKRVAVFKDNIIVADTYLFDNNAKDVKDVPVNHEICFVNAKDKIFEYLVQDITYEGETKEITSPFSFGKRMNVDFQEGYYSAKVVNNKIASDKIVIRYKVNDDFKCFDIRLFDPPLNTTNTNNTIVWNHTASNVTWEEFAYTLPGWFSYYWTEYNVTHSGKYSIYNTGNTTNVSVNFDLDKGTGYTFYMKRNSGNWTALANISSMSVGTNQTQNLTFKFDVQNQFVRWYATSSGYSNMTGDYNLTITMEES